MALKALYTNGNFRTVILVFTLAISLFFNVYGLVKGESQETRQMIQDEVKKAVNGINCNRQAKEELFETKFFSKEDGIRIEERLKSIENILNDQKQVLNDLRNSLGK